jgi:hypothetical protein
MSPVEWNIAVRKDSGASAHAERGQLVVGVEAADDRVPAADTFIMASLQPFWNEHLVPLRCSRSEGVVALLSVPPAASAPPGN